MELQDRSARRTWQRAGGEGGGSEMWMRRAVWMLVHDGDIGGKSAGREEKIVR